MNLQIILGLVFGVAWADFDWGTATAAYQIEGYTKDGGRTPSIWDAFCDPSLHHIKNGDSGDPADEDYVRYPETIGFLKGLGVKNYRLSLSWTRLVQEQTTSNPAGKINMEGVHHYIDVLEALQKAGIAPAVTLWHWDTPNAIEVNYGGFLDGENLPIFFAEYARVAFKYFGKYVKTWISLNEPYTLFQNGYQGSGAHAPGRCSDRSHCKEGDDLTEPYIVLHTQILAHAHAYRAFQEAQMQGDVSSDSVYGIVLNADWGEPLHDTAEDRAASDRYAEFQNGMYFDSIFHGDYPESLKSGVGDRLVPFTDDEKKLIRGSHTGVYFMNFYTAQYVSNYANNGGCGYECDVSIKRTHYDINGRPIGRQSTAATWLWSVGFGFRRMLNWISSRYGGIEIRVTENGWGDPDTPEDLNGMLNDINRCEYYRDYIGNMSLAVHRDGVNLKGYFAWSLMDNFEWADGYTTRFGLTYVNYTSQKRIPKMSYLWYKQVASLKELPSDGVLPMCKKIKGDSTFEEGRQLV